MKEVTGGVLVSKAAWIPTVIYPILHRRKIASTCKDKYQCIAFHFATKEIFEGIRISLLLTSIIDNQQINVEAKIDYGRQL